MTTSSIIKENKYKIVENIDNVYINFHQLKEPLKESLNIKTFYEKKWLENGETIKYLSFTIH